MKKYFDWQVLLALVLMVLSVLVYFIQYLIFKDLRDTVFYFLQDMAFLFMQVMLATFVLNKILTYRDKQNMHKKLNMVIGAFYSEIGTDLLKVFSFFDRESSNIVQQLVINNDWSKQDFFKMYKHINKHEAHIDLGKGNITELKNMLVSKRSFLLGLLENPNLLEHESFTDLLWAVFHLTEELSFRKNLLELKAVDAQHLGIDIKRAYILMISQWLSYMQHLKHDYPYLFSMALRTNPFDKDATVEIQ